MTLNLILTKLNQVCTLIPLLFKICCKSYHSYLQYGAV